MAAMKLGLEQRFEVKDGPRTITFIGWILGEADSRPVDEQPSRWTELALFKTIGGQYLLEKVGRSDVFHNETCEPGKPKKGKRRDNLLDAMPESEDADEYAVPEDFFVPCDKCNPDFADQPVWVERDIFSTSMFSTAQEVLDALYRPDTRNTSHKYLSRVARSLLDQAVEKDDAIRSVLTSPVEVD